MRVSPKKKYKAKTATGGCRVMDAVGLDALRNCAHQM